MKLGAFLLLNKESDPKKETPYLRVPLFPAASTLMGFSCLNKWQKVEAKWHVFQVSSWWREEMSEWPTAVTWCHDSRMLQARKTPENCVSEKKMFTYPFEDDVERKEQLSRGPLNILKVSFLSWSSIFYLNPYFLSLPLLWCFLSCLSIILLSSGFVSWFTTFTPVSHFSSVFPFFYIFLYQSVKIKFTSFFLFILLFRKTPCL